MKKLLAMATMVAVALGFVGAPYSWAAEMSQQRTSLTQKRADAKKAKKEKSAKKGKKEKQTKKTRSTRRTSADRDPQPNKPKNSASEPADK